jgi:carboxylate-amine ligase
MKPAASMAQSIPDEEPAEETAFQPSPEGTLGVELELQILDRESGELAPGAVRLLESCREEQLEGVSGEFLLSMVEVKTGICRNVTQVRDTLLPLLMRVRNIATSLGYDLAIGGTHPFGRATMSAIFPDVRYQRIQSQQGWMAYQEAVFGMHVHVGVPSGDAAIGVINQVVPYLPHLIALAANSPLWQGTDTGYASARMRMFRPSAHAGVPPHFEDWSGFCSFYEVLCAAGAIRKTKDIYWDIRPRPQLGTLEFRIFDAPATMSCLLALGALTRCLVLDALRRLEEQPERIRGDRRSFWLADDNRWRATRYGLHAECTRAPHGERQTLLADTAQLLKRLAPLASEAGEAGYLQALQPLEAFESGADRQRHIYRETGRWQAVVDDLRHRWLHELQEGPLARVAAAPLPPPDSGPLAANSAVVPPLSK